MPGVSKKTAKFFIFGALLCLFLILSGVFFDQFRQTLSSRGAVAYCQKQGEIQSEPIYVSYATIDDVDYYFYVFDDENASSLYVFCRDAHFQSRFRLAGVSHHDKIPEENLPVQTYLLTLHNPDGTLQRGDTLFVYSSNLFHADCIHVNYHLMGHPGWVTYPVGSRYQAFLVPLRYLHYKDSLSLEVTKLTFLDAAGQVVYEIEMEPEPKLELE